MVEKARLLVERSIEGQTATSQEPRSGVRPARSLQSTWQSRHSVGSSPAGSSAGGNTRRGSGCAPTGNAPNCPHVSPWRGMRHPCRAAAPALRPNRTLTARSSTPAAASMLRSRVQVPDSPTSCGASFVQATVCAMPKPHSAGPRVPESWCSASHSIGSPTITGWVDGVSVIYPAVPAGGRREPSFHCGIWLSRDPCRALEGWDRPGCCGIHRGRCCCA